MMDLTARWVIPWLALLAEWSVRWGVVIAMLAAWLALRPPKRTATRHLLCLAALAAGVLLPVTPRWGNAVVPWPAPRVRADGGAPPTVSAATALIVSPVAEPLHSPAAVGPISPQRTYEVVPRPGPAPTAARPDPVRPTTTSLSVWRVAALVAAAAWAAVALALLSRLAAGWRTLVRLRREAVEVGQESDRLLGECRAAVGLSRPVRIAVHPAVMSPAVIGGPSPVVLVPPDWIDWPEEHRRACLLHELAHLARYDDWARLAQELLRAPFFFHPAVRWLLCRLDREREILCDEAAVALGSDPLVYARLLLDMARRPGRLLAVTPSFRHGWLPFLDRRTVKVRIERLLEDDMLSTLSHSRPSVSRSLVLGSLAVAAALVVGGLRVRAGSAGRIDAPAPAPAVAEQKTDEFRGIVLDPDGHPVVGATIVAGSRDPKRWSGREVITTDAQGRFTVRVSPATELVAVFAYEDGFAVSGLLRDPRRSVDRGDLEIRLSKAAPFSAVLVDSAGKPVAGAAVRVETIAHPFEEGNRTGMSFTQLRREVIGGSPLEPILVTATDAGGAFSFRAFADGSGLNLRITTAEGRVLLTRPRPEVVGRTRRMMEEWGFVSSSPGETARVGAILAARVSGRVVSRLPNVRVARLTAFYQASRASGQRIRLSADSAPEVQTDASGRFTLDGLNEGTINVFLHGDGENKDWTYRAAQDVKLTSGMTSEVTIELIHGVEVEGTVVEQKTGTPVEGAQVGVYGPFRPRSGGTTLGATTDARGRYHYRLPSGETYFYVMGPPKGFNRLPGEDSSRTVTIPDGVSDYKVPPIELAGAVTVRGRVLDATGAPIAGATVVGTCEEGTCRPFPGNETVTDARGEFRLPPSLYNTVAIGTPARLLIRLRGGAEHEIAAVPTKDGGVTLKLPVTGKAPGHVEGPGDVAPDELAGIVVDTRGKPIGGAEVDAWTWYPGHEAKTNARGLFRIRRLDKDRKVEVVVRKPGYTPQLFLMQPPGQPGWVVVLDNKTYFEGRVTSPEGKPVAGARIRANNGPKRAEGVMIGEIWTEATTDEDGRYRLYAQADVYDIQVRVPGVGTARRSRTPLGADEAKSLDIALERSVTFRAEVVDSLTGDPVPGVRLWHWQHRGVEGRSKEDGLVEVPNMMPGPFQFQVEAPGYVRWWSEEASTEWSRRKIDETRGGWQRNFDRIDFNLQPDMKPVTITVERGVSVTGRVVDPDGKPVAGATVAPALTGTGNSLTGDTRFSAQTDRDGRFTVLLPASGQREYNLVAHDGKYSQWRTWANGVLPPFRTKPGETVPDVELRLTRPATVRGRVTDSGGRPVPEREVRASAADRLENRYYDPTTRTAADGTFELKFIRPGEQFIQVAPFWLDAREAPKGTSRTLTLKPDESKTSVDFSVPGAQTGAPVPPAAR